MVVWCLHCTKLPGCAFSQRHGYIVSEKGLRPMLLPYHFSWSFVSISRGIYGLGFCIYVYVCVYVSVNAYDYVSMCECVCICMRQVYFFSIIIY